MHNTILNSSQATFQWYLDNLQRIGFYDITPEQREVLKTSIDNIEEILTSIPVEG